MNFSEFDDYKALREFYMNNDLEVSDDIVGQDGAVFSVAGDENGKILAAATLSQRHGIFILDYIAVASDLRGKGIGREIFRLIQQKSVLLNADRIYLTARNPGFFRTLGFMEGSPENVDMNADCKGCLQYGNICVSVPMYKEVFMTRDEFIRLKAELLCYGASLTEESKHALEQERPEFFEKGFIDAVNMNVNGSNICVSIAEEFSESSDLLLKKDESGYYIMYKGYRNNVRFFHKLPETGTVVDDLARLHADGCINIWPSTNCCYDKPDIKCKFCSLLPKTPEPISINELTRGIKILLEKHPDYTLNFSGATYKSPDTMVEYWCDLCRNIRKFSNCPIAVEFAPPEDLSLIKKLHDSGATVAIMNIEVVDNRLRKKICPGKSAITLEHYHKAFEKAVECFGFGQVSSVMIGGIQPKEDIINECEIIARMGVFPTIMPFRPLDDCTLSEMRACDPDDLIQMSEHLGKILREYGLSPHRQEGCTKCGGCSIENDCYKK